MNGLKILGCYYDYWNKIINMQGLNLMILIETPRLQLRHFEKGDVDAVLAFSSNSDVTKYTGDAGLVNTRAQAMKVITDVWLADYEKYGYGRYAVIHKADNKVIGFCGLKFLEDVGKTDLGYRFLPQYWGQGIGIEAAKACLQYGVEQLQIETVFAMAMPENKGSVAILQKLGFVELGHMDYDGHDVIAFEIKKASSV